MPNPSYLDWVIRNTRTQWWHDSAQATELALGLERGAIGVTTNPYLANLALVKDRQLLAPAIEAVLARNLPPEQKAEALMRIAVTATAAKLMPQFEASQGQSGPGGTTPGPPISPSNCRPPAPAWMSWRIRSPRGSPSP